MMEETYYGGSSPSAKKQQSSGSSFWSDLKNFDLYQKVKFGYLMSSRWCLNLITLGWRRL